MLTMVSMRNFALAASSIISLVSAAPAELTSRQVPPSTPGSLNNTQEFYVTLQTNDTAHANYNGYQIATYHTGAGFADPVFETSGARAYLNNTQLQFDVSDYPFTLIAGPGDTNYARWEPTSIGTGYGTPGFVNDECEGIVIDNEAFAGWLVCEWYHGLNLPQLFQLITGYAGPADYPSSCFAVKLVPEYF